MLSLIVSRGVVIDTTHFVMATINFVKDTTPHVAVSSYTFINFEVKQISCWIIN
jgi:hypothetical protein